MLGKPAQPASPPNNDARIAAQHIETGATFVTSDAHFSKGADLRLRSQPVPERLSLSEKKIDNYHPLKYIR